MDAQKNAIACLKSAAARAVPPLAAAALRRAAHEPEAIPDVVTDGTSQVVTPWPRISLTATGWTGGVRPGRQGGRNMSRFRACAPCRYMDAVKKVAPSSKTRRLAQEHKIDRESLVFRPR